MRKLLIFLLAGTIFTACNNNKDDRRSGRGTNNNRDDRYNNEEGWSSQVVRAFVDNCVEEAENGLTPSEALDYCECMQKKIERMYPDANDLESLDMESPRVKQMIEDCAPRP